MIDIEAATDEDILKLAGVDLPPEPQSKGPLKPVAEVTPIEALAGTLAGAAVILSLAAIIIERAILVVIAGILTVLVAPYSYYQQTQLTDIAALKETTAVVEQEVGRLKAENQRLGDNVQELSGTIDGLEGIEHTLEVIAATEGQNVSVLEDQIAENKEILSTMKKNTKGRIIQNLISIIYRGDSNMDDMISEEEVEKVTEGMKKIGGVKVRDDRLREAISGKSIDCVVGVVKNLMDDDISNDYKIFEIVDEE
mmetsp:Transcript_7176/g.21155  ORF Transcript_7176/g.21155 Transcript_7176/m.21155 type:complete len:253 (-) Transcript_7176:9-767(-)